MSVYLEVLNVMSVCVVYMATRTLADNSFLKGGGGIGMEAGRLFYEKGVAMKGRRWRS